MTTRNNVTFVITPYYYINPPALSFSEMLEKGTNRVEFRFYQTGGGGWWWGGSVRVEKNNFFNQRFFPETILNYSRTLKTHFYTWSGVPWAYLRPSRQ